MGPLTEVDMVERSTKRVTCEENIKVIMKMKPGKAVGLSEVNMLMFTASGETGIKVTIELCQHVLDERGI